MAHAAESRAGAARPPGCLHAHVQTNSKHAATCSATSIPSTPAAAPYLSAPKFSICSHTPVRVLLLEKQYSAAAARASEGWNQDLAASASATLSWPNLPLTNTFLLTWAGGAGGGGSGVVWWRQLQGGSASKDAPAC
jgi:hypothetical protein